MVSIPSIWDLLLQLGHAISLRETGGCFNPLNLGSAFATVSSVSRPRNRHRKVSIPSIWDLLLQLAPDVLNEIGDIARFNPLNLGSAFATVYRSLS